MAKFVGTPKEITYVVKKFFDAQRTYIGTVDYISDELREECADSMERELWEITITPMNQRSIVAVRDTLRDEVEEDEWI